MLARIIALLEKNKLVNDSNREIITYGMSKIIGTLTMLIFTLLLSGLMGDFLVGALFETCFITLRRYTGGYHAETQRRCLVMTYLSTLICVAAIFFVPINKFFAGLVVVLFNIEVIGRAPIENKNKPLNDIEKKIYRRKAIVITLVLSALFLIFNIVKLTIYSKTIIVAMLLVFIGMLCATHM